MDVVANTQQNTQLFPISNLDIVRAWRDARYRRSLSAEQLQWLPNHPAGPAELTADELMAAEGLALGQFIATTTAPNCTVCTFDHLNACGCGVGTTAVNCTLNAATCPCA